MTTPCVAQEVRAGDVVMMADRDAGADERDRLRLALEHGRDGTAVSGLPQRHVVPVGPFQQA